MDETEFPTSPPEGTPPRPTMSEGGTKFAGASRATVKQPVVSKCEQTGHGPSKHGMGLYPGVGR
jgi:hypothetical protein